MFDLVLASLLANTVYPMINKLSEFTLYRLNIYILDMEKFKNGRKINCNPIFCENFAI